MDKLMENHWFLKDLITIGVYAFMSATLTEKIRHRGYYLCK